MLAILSDPRTPLALAALAALLRAVYALVSRLVAPHPRARAAVEALAALAPDVLRAALQLVAAVTGRPALRLDAVPIGDDPATLRRELDAALTRARTAEESLARLEAQRVVTRPMRPTLVPGGEAGYASVPAMLVAVVVGLVVVLPLAVAVSGCGGPLVRDPAAQIAVRVAWPSVHKGAISAGLCDDDPPAWLVGETPTRHDAGVNTYGASVNNTPVGVNNHDDASAPAPNDAAEVGAP